LAPAKTFGQPKEDSALVFGHHNEDGSQEDKAHDHDDDDHGGDDPAGRGAPQQHGDSLPYCRRGGAAWAGLEIVRLTIYTGLLWPRADLVDAHGERQPQ
jgi:hypothetical protein